MDSSLRMNWELGILWAFGMGFAVGSGPQRSRKQDR